MNKLLLAALLAAAALLAGCASSPSSSSSGAATSTAAAERLAPPVSVPPASRRKLVLAMTGPKSVVESKDWTELKREWRETFGDYARQAGIAYTFSETEAKPTGEDGTILRVNVADFRVVGIGARVLLGIMTGNAFIDARVTYLNLRDGSPYGEQQYNTTSSAWGGIFAKVTPQQVDSIAASVFQDLAPAQRTP